jgi:hypothetical protein
MACGSQEVRGRPQATHIAQFRKLLTQNAGGIAFDPADNFTRGKVWSHAAEQVNMVRHYFQCADFAIEFFDLLGYQFRESCSDRPDKHPAAIFGTKDYVVIDREDSAVVVGMFRTHKELYPFTDTEKRYPNGYGSQFLLPLLKQRGFRN